MKNVTPIVCSEATAVYYAAHAAVTKGFSSSRLHKDTTAWRQWDSFCRWIHISPDLHVIKDLVPFLQIFAQKVKTGVLALKKKAIQKRSVEQCIRSVGQIFAVVGAPDPRFNRVGSINFCLVRQLVAYKREDPPTSRFRPLPISVLPTLDATS